MIASFHPPAWFVFLPCVSSSSLHADICPRLCSQVEDLIELSDCTVSTCPCSNGQGVIATNWLRHCYRRNRLRLPVRQSPDPIWRSPPCRASIYKRSWRGASDDVARRTEIPIREARREGDDS